MKFILGRKLGMSEVFDEKGNQVPVTLVEAGPCVVTQIKTIDKDKYESVQVGFLPKSKNVKKTEKSKEFKNLKEFRVQGLGFKVGDTIGADVFQEGDAVKVSGISKGKGFAGVVKKWGFHGRPSTHGTKHEERTAGSTGMSGLGRVIKGLKMAGRMGSQRVSVKNLKIVEIDKENNILAIKGAVPGKPGTLLEIRN